MDEHKPAKDEQEDFYILPDGRYVMTAGYLRRRGYCCGNGCLNCPYDYMNVKEPYRTRLLEQRKAHE